MAYRIEYSDQSRIGGPVWEEVATFDDQQEAEKYYQREIYPTKSRDDRYQITEITPEMPADRPASRTHPDVAGGTYTTVINPQTGEEQVISDNETTRFFQYQQEQEAKKAISEAVQRSLRSKQEQVSIYEKQADIAGPIAVEASREQTAEGILRKFREIPPVFQTPELLKEVSIISSETNPIIKQEQPLRKENITDSERTLEDYGVIYSRPQNIQESIFIKPNLELTPKEFKEQSASIITSDVPQRLYEKLLRKSEELEYKSMFGKDKTLSGASAFGFAVASVPVMAVTHPIKFGEGIIYQFIRPDLALKELGAGLKINPIQTMGVIAGSVVTLAPAKPILKIIQSKTRIPLTVEGIKKEYQFIKDIESKPWYSKKIDKKLDFGKDVYGYYDELPNIEFKNNQPIRVVDVKKVPNRLLIFDEAGNIVGKQTQLIPKEDVYFEPQAEFKKNVLEGDRVMSQGYDDYLGKWVERPLSPKQIERVQNLPVYELMPETQKLLKRDIRIRNIGDKIDIFIPSEPKPIAKRPMFMFSEPISGTIMAGQEVFGEIGEYYKGEIKPKIEILKQRNKIKIEAIDIQPTYFKQPSKNIFVSGKRSKVSNNYLEDVSTTIFQEPSFGIIQYPLPKQYPINTQNIFVDIKNKSSVFPLLIQQQEAGQVQMFEQVQMLEQEQVQQQELLQERVEIPKTEEIMKKPSPKQKYINKPLINLPPRIPKLLPEEMSILSSIKDNRGAQAKGYDVYIKRKQLKEAKGKYQSRGYAKANTQPLSRIEALGLGADITDRYVNRSFYLKPSSKPSVPRPELSLRWQQLRNKFTTLKSNRNILKEKSKFAIDSLEEKKGIPYEALRLKKQSALKRSISLMPLGGVNSRKKASAKQFIGGKSKKRKEVNVKWI